MKATTNTNSQPRPGAVPVTCTERGCAAHTNGIAPYDRCPTHFAALQARLARHSYIKDLVDCAVSIDRTVRHLLLTLAIDCEELLSLEPIQPATVTDEQLAGWVMDLICANSISDGGSLLASPPSDWLPYVPCSRELEEVA